MIKVLGLTIIVLHFCPFEQIVMHNLYMLAEKCSRTRVEVSGPTTNIGFEQGFTNLASRHDSLASYV